MNRKFNRIYDQLYDFYEGRNILYKIPEMNNRLFEELYYELRNFNLRIELFTQRVRYNITIFEFENNFPLREDAKFFLLTTFDNMIIKPIVSYYLDESEDNEPNINFENFDKELFEIIDFDINLILRNSLRNKKEEKISGHEILKTVDNLWGEMKSSKVEIWG